MLEMLTVERLREVLNYDPGTGVFTWRIPRRKCTVDSPAGCKDPRGYVLIKLDRRSYYAHQLAWLYVYGTWPESGVDHRDEDKSNNRISNLREATTALNMQNRSRANRNSQTGTLGVRRVAQKFQARLKLNGKHIHLGTFATLTEARDAYLAAKARYHPFGAH